MRKIEFIKSYSLLSVIQPASISDAICGLCKFKKYAKFEF